MSLVVSLGLFRFCRLFCVLGLVRLRWCFVLLGNAWCWCGYGAEFGVLVGLCGVLVCI